MRDLTPLYGAVVSAVASVQGPAMPLTDLIQSIPDKRRIDVIESGYMPAFEVARYRSDESQTLQGQPWRGTSLSEPAGSDRL